MPHTWKDATYTSVYALQQTPDTPGLTCAFPATPWLHRRSDGVAVRGPSTSPPTSGQGQLSRSDCWRPTCCTRPWCTWNWRPFSAASDQTLCHPRRGGGGWNAQPGRSEQERPVKSLVSRRPCVMEKLSFGEGVGAVKSLASHLLTCMHGRRRDACVKAWFFQQTPDLDLSRKHHASVNSPPALSRFCLTAGPVSAICKTIHI